MLETVKLAIESTLHELFRSGALVRDESVLHLFATTHPYQPLASCEHDLLHFNYKVGLAIDSSSSCKSHPRAASPTPPRPSASPSVTSPASGSWAVSL